MAAFFVARQRGKATKSYGASFCTECLRSDEMITEPVPRNKTTRGTRFHVSESRSQIERESCSAFGPDASSNIDAQQTISDCEPSSGASERFASSEKVSPTAGPSSIVKDYRADQWRS